MKKTLQNTIVPLLLVLVIITGTRQWFILPMVPQLFFWAVQALLLLVFYRFTRKGYNRSYRYVNRYLIWVFISMIYGAFMSQGYFDTKSLITASLFYLMPLSAVYFSNPENVRPIMKYQIIALPIAFLVLSSLMYKEGISRLFYVISFPLFFFPLLKKGHKLYLLLAVTAFLLFGAVDSRASIIRIIGSLLLSFLLFSKVVVKSIKKLKFICFSFFVIPTIFFVLGVTDIFNVFRYIEDNFGGEVSIESEIYDDYEADIAGDTRTFIYKEVLESSISEGYVLYGHSLSRGYVSDYFGQDTDMISTSRSERYQCEIGILNYYTHMGLIGVVLYTFIFLFACIRVFNRSRSYTLKALSCWIAFRWLLSWVEEFTYFDINNIVLWIAISMCLSPNFLKMDDNQIISFLNDCFPTFGKFFRQRRYGQFRSIGG